MTVASLVDTNILVYAYDSREPEKQLTAQALLRRGLESGQLHIPHQAITEFMAVVSRRLSTGETLLPREESWRQTEFLLATFPILYPDADVVRTALRGMATYQLSWYDAHLWAYADRYGLSEILSEDFEHGRLYGSVRIINPFLRSARS